MRAMFDRAELTVLLQDFYELTGLRAVVFDASGADILSYPHELPLFCRLIRSTANGHENCIRCDQNACKMAQKSSKTLVYSCHAGLLEMIMPIRVEEVTVGYLLLGHIVLEDAAFRQVYDRCCGYGVLEGTLRDAYEALPHISKKVLSAAGDLLSLAAKALYQERLARLAPESHYTKLPRFLFEHLTEPLSCERVCKALSLSRSRLYHLSYELYGCGISEQITKMRIERAQDLLCDTTYSITDISEKSGFRDPNYFYRVFRRSTGMTPKEYRKRFQKESKNT